MFKNCWTNGPRSSLGAAGGQKGVPTLVDMCVVAMACRGGASSRVDMARFLVLAGGAVVVG